MSKFTKAQITLSQNLRDELWSHPGLSPGEVQEVLRDLVEHHARIAKRYEDELACGF